MLFSFLLLVVSKVKEQKCLLRDGLAVEWHILSGRFEVQIRPTLLGEASS